MTEGDSGISVMYNNYGLVSRVMFRRFLRTGWTGTNCSVDRNDCTDNPCRRGSTCVDKLDDFSCQCSPGYEGNASVYRLVTISLFRLGSRCRVTKSS